MFEARINTINFEQRSYINVVQTRKTFEDLVLYIHINLNMPSIKNSKACQLDTDVYNAFMQASKSGSSCLMCAMLNTYARGESEFKLYYVSNYKPLQDDVEQIIRTIAKGT